MIFLDSAYIHIYYFIKIGGADDGNRTRVLNLGSWYSAVELHLHVAVSCQWGCHPKAFCISLDELRFFRPSVSLAFHKLLHLRPCYSLTLFKLGCIIISIAMKLTYFIALSWSLYFELRSTNGGQSRIRTYEKHSTTRMPSIMLANLQFAAFSRLHIRPCLHYCFWSYCGGKGEIWTHGLPLARRMLFQLSYNPIWRF